jgi:hypothetical protein
MLGGLLAAAVWLLAGGCASAVTRPEPIRADAGGVAAAPVLAEPTGEEPVTAVAWVNPGRAARGAMTEVRVRVRIAPGYFLHPADAAPPFAPTSIELAPSDAVRPAGEWSRAGAAGAGRLSGELEFRRPVRVVDGAAAGRHEVVCKLTFQACTPELCWPVRVLTLPASLVVSPATRKPQ